MKIPRNRGWTGTICLLSHHADRSAARTLRHNLSGYAKFVDGLSAAEPVAADSTNETSRTDSTIIAPRSEHSPMTRFSHWFLIHDAQPESHC